MLYLIFTWNTLAMFLQHINACALYFLAQLADTRVIDIAHLNKRCFNHCLGHLELGVLQQLQLLQGLGMVDRLTLVNRCNVCAWSTTNEFATGRLTSLKLSTIQCHSKRHCSAFLVMSTLRLTPQLSVTRISLPSATSSIEQLKLLQRLGMHLLYSMLALCICPQLAATRIPLLFGTWSIEQLKLL